MNTDDFEDPTVLARIDAMAEELRQRIQGWKRLTDWHLTPNSSKRKWVEHARALYATAVRKRAEEIE